MSLSIILFIEICILMNYDDDDDDDDDDDNALNRTTSTIKYVLDDLCKIMQRM